MRSRIILFGAVGAIFIVHGGLRAPAATLDTLRPEHPRMMRTLEPVWGTKS